MPLDPSEKLPPLAVAKKSPTFSENSIELDRTDMYIMEGKFS